MHAFDFDINWWSDLTELVQVICLEGMVLHTTFAAHKIAWCLAYLN